MSKETEIQTRLRRAKEALDACIEAETEARKALARASDATKMARDKHHDLFLVEGEQERIRKIKEYSHYTG